MFDRARRRAENAAELEQRRRTAETGAALGKSEAPLLGCSNFGIDPTDTSARARYATTTTDRFDGSGESRQEQRTEERDDDLE